jgi:hypothetical protein
MKPEQIQEILDLRSRNLTPKQIARKLGLRVAEVTGVIKSQATQSAIAAQEMGILPPVSECLADIGCVRRLLGEEAIAPEFRTTSENKQDEDAKDEDAEDKDMSSGLGLVIVTRSTGFNRFLFASYLVDYWCLGVKSCIPPRQLNGSRYREMLQYAYNGFLEGYQTITLDQARAIIFGSVEYAASLGLKPDPDFEQAKAHLGASNHFQKLQFGRNGKPFYFSGPYDDPDYIIDTLRKSVGDGNFGFTMALGDDLMSDFFLDDFDDSDDFDDLEE